MCLYSFPSASTVSTANKRYLILTYAVEFDRVHYPLPLSLVQTPTPEILQRTIRRLRQVNSLCLVSLVCRLSE